MAADRAQVGGWINRSLAPDPEDVVVFKDAADLRRWLEANHATASELWVGYYKKGVPKPSVTYKEAVEEALCFGWIDGIGHRIDDEVHVNRYTPRTTRSTWSSVNVGRMEGLIRAGRAHPAGVRAFEARSADNTGIYAYENRPAELPDAYLKRFKMEEAAWRWWQAQSRGYRRNATWWVSSAKREATRERRFVQLIADCAAGQPIKPQRYGPSGGATDV